MSLILDALKKSEAERMRGQVPTLLSPLPAAQSHTRTSEKSGLPLIVIIALLITVLIVGYIYTKRQVTTSPDLVTAVVNQPSKQAPVTVDSPVTAPKPVPVETAAVPPDLSKASAPVVPITPTSVVPETSQTAPVIAEAAPATTIASLSELSTEQRQQLPTLKLSMHVYSPETSKRFAIIDGQRVNEGSVLGAAVVEQIRQDGVVLSLQGQSYLLPRP